MKKMKVYLAKSNRANPDVVARVRQTLSNYNLEIVEFKGGTYSHKQMLECDFLVVVPEILNNHEFMLGKGLHEQMTSFVSKNSWEEVLFITSKNLEVREIDSIEIEDENDYVDYSIAYVDTTYGDSLTNILENVVSGFYLGTNQSRYATEDSSVSKTNSNYYLLIGKKV